MTAGQEGTNEMPTTTLSSLSLFVVVDTSSSTISNHLLSGGIFLPFPLLRLRARRQEDMKHCREMDREIAVDEEKREHASEADDVIKEETRDTHRRRMEN